MKDLKFSSVNEALQHLADITGKRVKIAKKLESMMVYSGFDNKKVIGYKESNSRILVDKDKLSDSDKQIITDDYGYRYKRNIPLESEYKQMVFEKI